ncbi:MAG: ATP-dependent sacrificial sulfur transferase LarE [Euryarchaeota archaeon]|nr:ATP-dependent sacrificial sulfur transferase LarE [Euryarchaeota archaeon]
MDRLQNLRESLKDKDNIILAFSGGLDSTFLAYLLKDWGKRFTAVTVDNGLLLDLESIKGEAEALGVDHRILEVDVLSERNFQDNTTERCYFCKKMIISRLKEFQAEEGYDWIMDATNTSDLKDYRAGMVALKEEGILSPLLDAGITKEDILELSREFGLKTKPPESCMATRIQPYDRIHRRDIARIREVEREVRALGFATLRARKHKELLRFQFLATEMEHALGEREKIREIGKAHGFQFVVLDLEPYPFEYLEYL